MKRKASQNLKPSAPKTGLGSSRQHRTAEDWKRCNSSWTLKLWVGNSSCCSLWLNARILLLSKKHRHRLHAPGSDYNKSAQPDTSTFTIPHMLKSCHAAPGSQAPQIPREKIKLFTCINISSYLSYCAKVRNIVLSSESWRQDGSSRWRPRRWKRGADGAEKLPLVPNDYLSRSSMIAFTLFPSLSTWLLSQRTKWKRIPPKRRRR